MKISVFAFSKRGLDAARHAADCLNEHTVRLFSPERLTASGFTAIPKPSEEFYGERFKHDDAMLFVGACGIAVRAVAPWVCSKLTDPAVLVMDETEQNVIPILSGHVGGANRLARSLAAAIGARAVITTATDICNRFSVDDWAAEKGFCISDMKLAAEISAAILERDIPVSTALPVIGETAPGLYIGQSGELGIYIGAEKKQPFDRTLRIVPKILHLGIGCRKGTPAENIRMAVDAVMEKHGLDFEAVRDVATIDIKSEEQGLLCFCEESNLPLVCYSAEELQAVEGSFASSDFVRSVTGVDNVCERAACANSARLIVKKTARDGVTVAVAQEETEVRFE